MTDFEFPFSREAGDLFEREVLSAEALLRTAELMLRHAIEDNRYLVGLVKECAAMQGEARNLTSHNIA